MHNIVAQAAGSIYENADIIMAANNVGTAESPVVDKASSVAVVGAGKAQPPKNVTVAVVGDSPRKVKPLAVSILDSGKAAEASAPAKRTRTKKGDGKGQYNPAARGARMKSLLKTIVKMVDSGEKEFTIPALKSRLKLPLLGQIKKGEVKEASISADINAAMKVMGGFVELRRERGARGRPHAVYAFDASTLTERGKEIMAAVDIELRKSKK